ncbi:hypothetical protein GCM10010404_87050 [Nonomuraea africana]|uniref:NAD(P)-dependent dehydrogenase (Short-subunit alcohol dehydrogenase family) n=1 Tax=Nonomuraea africana TaxID=46171 RepID=A0ABR9K9P3_9ACTN|nr:SDR family NAD(P)-dependent oxidoreductase [Nonomuraea africana]MBE1558743.1 NAD(P)-dependent dehydrogenase (short-subunit alcohol dehydrogenase family) [Nonomuraea africana]
MASTVVVTGGNRGIGYAVCERLAGEGFKVLLVARDPERGARAVASIEGDVGFVAGDLTTIASVRRLARDAELAGRVWKEAEALTSAG